MFQFHAGNITSLPISFRFSIDEMPNTSNNRVINEFMRLLIKTFMLQQNTFAQTVSVCESRFRLLPIRLY